MLSRTMQRNVSQIAGYLLARSAWGLGDTCTLCAAVFLQALTMVAHKVTGLPSSHSRTSLCNNALSQIIWVFGTFSVLPVSLQALKVFPQKVTGVLPPLGRSSSCQIVLLQAMQCSGAQLVPCCPNWPDFFQQTLY